MPHQRPRKPAAAIIAGLALVFIAGLIGCVHSIPSTAPPSTPVSTHPSNAATGTPFATRPDSVPNRSPQETSIPPHTHSYLKSITAATCNQEGHTTYACECGDSYEANIIAPLGHSFGEWTTTCTPTCTTEGTAMRTCSACGETVSEALPTAQHRYECVYSLPPTTTEEGTEEYLCTSCGAAYSKVLTKLRGIEADLCGNSLLGKVLPHDEYAEFSQQALAAWANRLSQDASREAGGIQIPADNSRAFLQTWSSTYAYIAQPLPYTVVSNTNEPGRFCCWGSEEEYALQEAAYIRIGEILSELHIDATTTQREAVCRINSWLCAHKDYDYTPDPYAEDFTLYYAITNPVGVCRHYAMAFQALCLGAGIECYYISSETMNHAWNYIYFSDGSIYWVDVCWNDTGSDPSRYLLISSERLSKTHNW